jgi:hypothetical protein
MRATQHARNPASFPYDRHYETNGCFFAQDVIANLLKGRFVIEMPLMGMPVRQVAWGVQAQGALPRSSRHNMLTLAPCTVQGVTPALPPPHTHSHTHATTVVTNRRGRC